MFYNFTMMCLGMYFFSYLSWYLGSLNLKILILLFLELIFINSGKFTVVIISSIFSLPFLIFLHLGNLMLGLLILFFAFVNEGDQSPSLHRTEGFLRMWDFQYITGKVPGKTGWSAIPLLTYIFYICSCYILCNCFKSVFQFIVSLAMTVKNFSIFHFLKFYFSNQIFLFIVSQF